MALCCLLGTVATLCSADEVPKPASAVNSISQLQANGAKFTVNGTDLSVASSNIQVSFSGADVVGITNLLTSEKYLRNGTVLWDKSVGVPAAWHNGTVDLSQWRGRAVLVGRPRRGLIGRRVG
jgi:hypothetical protein